MNYADQNLNPIMPSVWVHADVQYPATIFANWTDSELAGVGIYRVHYPEVDPPERQHVASWDYVLAGNHIDATPVYADTPRYVPAEVEGWQAEVAMRVTPVDPEEGSQSVWDRVQELVSAMPDGPEKIMAGVVLNRGKVRRDSDLLAVLSAMVPLSGDRVDDLFILADSLEA